MIRVLIAEDDASVRDALVSLIATSPAMKVVAAIGDADAAIEQATALRPDVAIVDVRMPGGGARAAREIKRYSRDTKVMALSAFADRSTVLEMLEAGVVAYHVKGSSTASLLESIERVADGESSLSIEVTGEVIGELVEQLAVHRRRDERRDARRTRIERVIEREGTLEAFLQPICSLDSGVAVGFEALARFHCRPRRQPDRWFAEAGAVGLRPELELAAAQRGLAHLSRLPDNAYLSINLSPTLMPSPAFRELLTGADAKRIVIEITEHAPIEDYRQLREGIESMRNDGIRLAVDDAGAGFASLKHILELAPDFIKLDRSLVTGIERNPSEQALAAGLISFSEKIGATIVAEGVERIAERKTLRELGVRFGQGYLLGSPAAAEVALVA